MLDDLKVIAQKDPADTIGLAGKQAVLLQSKFELELDSSRAENVILSGMGGSALSAGLVKSWPGVPVPFETVKNYDLPSYVGEKTLFIASSFSGNTEETLSALEQAEEAGAQIVVIAAGGKLAEIAEEKQYPFARLDENTPQPRMAAFESYKAVVSILEAAGLAEGAVAEMEAAGEKLANATDAWSSTVLAAKNQAKQIAQELVGRTVVVYGGPLMAPVAYKWKISINENAKNVAWTNFYPEFNHNEFIGWSSHPVEKPYAVINLLSDKEHPRIPQRFEISDKLLSGKRPHPITVNLEGDSLIEQMLWGTMLGDFVSLYLAVLNGVNPEPVELVEKLKVELKKV